jgi:hypothetical protein
VFEIRAGDGELLIYLQGNNVTPGSVWVVLGKFARPRDDERYFYVSDRTCGPWTAEGKVTYHEDLLMAVSRIMEIKLQWEERHGN